MWPINILDAFANSTNGEFEKVAKATKDIFIDSKTTKSANDLIFINYTSRSSHLQN